MAAYAPASANGRSIRVANSSARLAAASASSNRPSSVSGAAM
jgi:hypothetical protein